MRGFIGETANEFEDWFDMGTLWLVAGDPPAFMDPNCMPFPPGFPPTEAPFAMYPLVPAALIVTEGLRP